ncbi:unnamed protein product, partial [Ilex paraguariensis]
MATNRGKQIAQIEIRDDDNEEVRADYFEINAPDQFLTVNNDDCELKVGMLAFSEDETFNMYNKYAYNKGFSIRKGHKSFSRNT